MTCDSIHGPSGWSGKSTELQDAAPCRLRCFAALSASCFRAYRKWATSYGPIVPQLPYKQLHQAPVRLFSQSVQKLVDKKRRNFPEKRSHFKVADTKWSEWKESCTGMILRTQVERSKSLASALSDTKIVISKPFEDTSETKEEDTLQCRTSNQKRVILLY